MKRILFSIFAALLLGSCGPVADDGPINVAIIGEPSSMFQQGVRLSPAAQHLRAASFEGLVALDPAGQIVPAIAERWIIADDGLSYIFRLRNTQWPDGEPITATDIRDLLNDNLDRLEGTSLGLDFAKLVEVRAMTGRVVELRLSSPMPEFLRLLAQPELGFVKSGGGAGPMIASREEGASLARLSALPPESRGLPSREDWEELARRITVRALPAQAAVDAFADGEVDLILNGRLSSFPLAQLGPLSRGAIQVDPAIGVFGLVFRSDAGVLADPARREALSMALDRDALIQPFGIGGWQPTTWIVPRPFFANAPYPESRWPDQTMEQRTATARRRIAQWSGGQNAPVELRLGLPEGPGNDILFRQIAESWEAIGIRLQRVGPGEGADLELRDRLARYSSPRWFLNQFNCELEVGLCSPEADELVRTSLTLTEPEPKQAALAEAHQLLMAEEVFIPLGAPVRWSLVRGAIESYVPNQWGLHPLFPLSQPTT